MRRISSQLILASPTQVLQNHVVELDNDGVIKLFIDLKKQSFETSHTLYYDGVLSSGIVSLSQHLSKIELVKLGQDFNYVKLTTDFHQNELFKIDEKPLIIDFGTSSLVEVVQIIQEKCQFISEIDALQFILACTYYPAFILNSPTKLELSERPELILWNGIDLINKRLKQKTKLSFL